jgi:hypothetical protein
MYAFVAMIISSPGPMPRASSASIVADVPKFALTP